MNRTALEEQLRSAQPARRCEAVRRLADQLEQGIVVPQSPSPTVNVMLSTASTTPASSQTPSSLAWGARCAGWYAVGLFNEDDMDGLEEFHDAGCALNIRTCVGMTFPVFSRELMHAMHGQTARPGRLILGGVGLPYRRLGRPEEDFLQRRKRAAPWDPLYTIPPAAAGIPDVKTATRFILGAGGIPCLVWSDKEDMGEPQFLRILEATMREGVGAIALRLHLPDGAARSHLHFVLETAERLHVPVAAGPGQNADKPLFDMAWWCDRDIQPYQTYLHKSAQLFHGHTLLQRGDAIGYTSIWAKRHFPDLRDRNAFYEQVGQWVPARLMRMWSDMPHNMTPSEILSLAQQGAAKEYMP
jgi:hypothetical protein